MANKFIYGLCASFILVPLQTQAADVGSAKKKAPSLMSQEPVSQWSGFYAARMMGYGHSKVSSRDAGRASYTMNGTTGSSVTGYAWQHNNWIYGLEADIGIHEIKGKTAGNVGIAGHQGDNLWSAAAKARLGYDLGRFQPFMMVGLAWGEFHQHNWPGTFYFGDVKQTAGFTVGAGVEARVWRQFYGRVDYNYTHFGKERFNLVGSSIQSDLSNHFVRLGLVYRPGSMVAKASPANQGEWEGMYLGGSVAARWSEAKTANPANVSTTIDANGALFGLYGGRNWQHGAWVYGIDSQLNLAFINGDKPTTGLPALDYREMWSATARGRLGYSFGRYLPYLAAGIQYGQFEQAVPATGSTAVEPLHLWTVGAGVDVKIDSKWSTRLDYSYARSFDTANPGLDATRYSTKVSNQTVKLGLTYHFGR